MPTWKNMSEEEKETYRKKRRAKVKLMSEEEKQDKRSKDMQRYLKRRTLLSAKERADIQEARIQKMLNKRTPEERQAAREETLRKSKEKRIARVAEVRAWFVEYKSTQACAVCKENDPDVFDFHHINPKEKENGITNIVHHGTLLQLQDEIAKCIILCANCHRKLHAAEKRG